MSDVTAYNEMLEIAYLNTNRRLRQALTALQACVDRLNETCDSNEEWWQNVDVFFEDATLKDPRSKVHMYDYTRRVRHRLRVVVPHALDITNSLNMELVHQALDAHIRSLGIGPMDPVPHATVAVAGHTITVESTDQELEIGDPYVGLERPW